MRSPRGALLACCSCVVALHVHHSSLPTRGRSVAPRMALKLEVDPEAAAQLLEEGPQLGLGSQEQ